MLNKKTKQISGPVNAMRLIGEVNGIEKIIYLFADQHLPIFLQTSCKNKKITILKYLSKQFRDTDKKIDFFMEISKSDIKYYEKIRDTRFLRYIETET